MSTAFSMSKMKVSTCQPLFKILAKSFITEFHSYAFSRMHVFCLTKVYIHQDVDLLASAGNSNRSSFLGL